MEGGGKVEMVGGKGAGGRGGRGAWISEECIRGWSVILMKVWKMSDFESKLRGW